MTNEPRAIVRLFSQVCQAMLAAHKVERQDVAATRGWDHELNTVRLIQWEDDSHGYSISLLDDVVGLYITNPNGTIEIAGEWDYEHPSSGELFTCLEAILAAASAPSASIMQYIYRGGTVPQRSSYPVLPQIRSNL
jgi:hypothetical protein